MSYTDSGFDKRVRNLLVAAESAAPGPELPANPFYYMSAAAQFAAYGIGVENVTPLLLDSSALAQNGDVEPGSEASVVSSTRIRFKGPGTYDYDSLATVDLSSGFSFFVQARLSDPGVQAQLIGCGMLDSLVLASLEFFLVRIGGGAYIAAVAVEPDTTSFFFGVPIVFDEDFFIEIYVAPGGPSVPTLFLNGVEFAPPGVDPVTVAAALNNYLLVTSGDMTTDDSVKNIVAWNRVLTEPERVQLREWAAAQP